MRSKLKKAKIRWRSLSIPGPCIIGRGKKRDRPEAMPEDLQASENDEMVKERQRSRWKGNSKDEISLNGNALLRNHEARWMESAQEIRWRSLSIPGPCIIGREKRRDRQEAMLEDPQSSESGEAAGK